MEILIVLYQSQIKNDANISEVELFVKIVTTLHCLLFQHKDPSYYRCLGRLKSASGTMLTSAVQCCSFVNDYFLSKVNKSFRSYFVLFVLKFLRNIKFWTIIKASQDKEFNR